MITLKHSYTAAVAAATLLLLAACGGNGGDEPAPIEDPNLVPASAAASTTAWFQFAKALLPSDTSEALALSNVGALPTSETEEPQTLGQ
jgi:hypothetical protein